MNFFNKFEVSPFATVFLIIVLLAKTYKLFFIYFLITLIHELGHALMAFLLHVKVNKIRLLPIGFNAEITNIDNLSSLKQTLIVLAGPFTYFISYYLLGHFYKVDYISYNSYVQSLQINKYVLLFNLLPVIPLDGGRFLKVIIDFFFTSKKALITVSIISFLFMFIFFYFTINTPQWLIYIFLLFTNIFYMFMINKNWKLFLVNRLSITNKYKIKIHSKNDLYKNKNNYIIMNKSILDEKKAIIKILKRNY